jgi:signal transduction histidine kinase
MQEGNQGKALASARMHELEAGPDLIVRTFLQLPVGVALLRAGADCFSLVMSNPQFAKDLGLDSTPAESTDVQELFDPSQRSALLQALRRVASGGEATTLVALQPASQEEHPSTRSLDLDVVGLGREEFTTGPSPGYLLLVIHDPPLVLEHAERQHRDAQRLQQRADRLAELERAKSEFLNLASHELRGPAALLRGYLSMLEDGSLGPLPDPVRQALPMLAAKANQINLMANEMVEAARLEDKQPELHLQPLDVRELVARVCSDVQATSPNHHVRFLDHAGRPVEVLADPMRLEIIVSNLLENAVKYSPAGGDVECDLSLAGELAMIAVRDTGIGIAPEDMARLFVRFSRLVPPEMTDIPGTGLGLYLARELARLHGGDIHAVSRLGEGSEFTLSLPLRGQAESSR